MLKLFFRKLDRLLTAISYAEAGDLDAAKEMLEQCQVSAGKSGARAKDARDVASGCRRSAKILDFKRAKPAARILTGIDART